MRIVKMMIQVSETMQKINSLEAVVEAQREQIVKMEALIKYYEECFRLAQQRRFGASSEHSPDQLRFEELFNEAEEQSDPAQQEPIYEQILYTRKKRVGKREEDLSGLPVERIDYELPESERICPECGEPMHDMGVTVRDEIEIIPAQVIHKEHAVHAYQCDQCKKNNASTIIKAVAPTPLISGSLASPSAVAHIASEKFVNGVPLYRSEKGFIYDGVMLSRQTMANWLIYCAQNYLAALYSLMISCLLKEDIAHADETTVQVLLEPGRPAQAHSYEWLYRTGKCSEHPVVIYEYQETRKQEHPTKFLEGFNGYLHTDGYQVYHNLPTGIIVVGCWSHARRYWVEAYKVIPKDKCDGSNAERGLLYCNLLFLFEEEFRDLAPEERYRMRLEYSKPVSDEFFSWISALGALPKSSLGKAVNYALSQRKYLENIYLDGRLEISNNLAERSIKPFVQGRKQWLFSCTPNGAESSSIYYSIIETAKANNLNPFQYLKFLLEKLPDARTGDLESLLPWSDSLPDCCHVPIKTSTKKSEKLSYSGEKGRLHHALIKLRERFTNQNRNESAQVPNSS
jgi:transposase